MAENPFTNSSTAAPLAPGPTAPSKLDPALIAQSDPTILSDANWLWWIAALSLVNTVLIHSGSDTSFAIGLGFTLVVDAMFQGMKFVAFAIDLVAIGAIFALGWFARRGQLWAFITGAILYSIDALIYLPLKLWIAVGFHVLAVVFLVRGAKNLRAALKVAAEGPPIALGPPPATG